MTRRRLVGKECNVAICHENWWKKGRVHNYSLPSESAILMTALSASPIEAFADQHVVELHLPQDAVDRIANRIWQVLEKGPVGSAVRLADGPYPGSVFLASTETYDLFNTCNTWTAALLYDAGLPIDPQVLLADQVMQQVDRIAILQARQRR